MTRKIAVILALQTALVIGLFWALVYYGRDEYEAYTREQDDDIASPSHVSSTAGASSVSLSGQMQAQSGIVSSALQAGTRQATLSTYGSVVPIDTLIDLRARYLAARAEATAERTVLARNREEYQRLFQLNQDNRNVSDRAVATADGAVKASEAKITAAEALAASIRDSMRQQWGSTLTDLATTGRTAPALQKLLESRAVVLQITLPVTSAAPKPGSRLAVTPVSGAAAKPVTAEFLSASPQTDAAISGKTYYYLAAADELRAGMRVSVSMGGGQASGVIVPASAVVWYGGKAWVYRKQGAEQFVRVPVSTDSEADGGWFNNGDLKAGDEVLTSGAQLLLSEEFKYQIKNENED